MSLPTISMSLWRRPRYTQRALESLAASVGERRYRLVIVIDTGGGLNRDVLKLARSQTWPTSAEIHVNEKPLGCNGTVYRALELAFAKAETVIHVEDDVVLSPDAIGFFEWALAHYADRKQVLSIGAWRHPHGWLPTARRAKFDNEHQRVGFGASFSGWGWATWADRWPIMRDSWTSFGDMQLSWDDALNAERGRRGMLEILPYASRSQNIGAELGTHRGDALLDYWAGSETARDFIEC